MAPPRRIGLRTLAVTLLLGGLLVGVELLSNALAEWVVVDRSFKIALLSPLQPRGSVSMRNFYRGSLAAGAVLAALSFPVDAETDGGFLRIPPEQVPFKSPVGLGPSQAALYGDPSKPGVYFVRNRFPPGAHSKPHFHSQDRHATVIKGVWWTGVGEKIDFNAAVPLKEGAYMFHPAGGVHWDGAGDEEVIVQIVGVGPVTTTPAAAPDAPDNWPKPK